MKTRSLAAALLAAILLTCAAGAFAQPSQAAPPSCWLVTSAKGYTQGSTDAALFASWWCPDAWGDYGPAPAMVVMKRGYTLMHPVLPATSTPADTAAAYWRLNVGFSCSAPPADWALQACTAATNAANQTRPLPPYVVAPNGTQATRPTYPASYRTAAGAECVAGSPGCALVRGTASNGRVDVLTTGGRPVACNPAQTVPGTMYMQVKRTPGTVALCRAS